MERAVRRAVALAVILAVMAWPPAAGGQVGAGISGSPLLGDVNCDGDINSVDAAVVLQYDAGLIAVLKCDVGDANADRRTDSVDAALILQFDAGLICEPFGDLCVPD
jgi:hypothetical protein